jgi:hypothetical protein
LLIGDVTGGITVINLQDKQEERWIAHSKTVTSFHPFHPASKPSNYLLSFFSSSVDGNLVWWNIKKSSTVE